MVEVIRTNEIPFIYLFNKIPPPPDIHTHTHSHTHTHTVLMLGRNDKQDRSGPCLYSIYNLLLAHNFLKGNVDKDNRIEDNLEYPYLRGIKGKIPQRRQRSSNEKSVRIAKII